MAPKDSDASGAASPSSHSPGRLIALAREAKSMGPADLALRLRLDTKVIKALERDDFENLPEPMFVKGYIRSIAKELGIDSAPMLEAYTSHASLDPPSIADFSSRPPDQVGINSTVIKIVSYGLGVLLVGLIILWWRSNYMLENAASGDDLPSQGAALEDTPTPLPYRYEVVTHDETSWQAEIPAIETPVDADDIAVETIDANAAPEAEVIADNELEITTSSEAWVEVYDAAGERLYFGMARAGQAVSLDGHPYYRLILGNTDSITLSLNDAAVELAPFSKEGVAQLELGAKPTQALTNP